MRRKSMGKKGRRGKGKAKPGRKPKGALHRVKRFMEGLDGRRPTRKQVREILPELRTLYRKFRKIRRLSPIYRTVNLSADIQDLLIVAGVASRKVLGLRDAAAS
jgi:hypothetical protein